MKYYSVAEIDIIDQSWVRDYVVNVTPLVQQFGGRYLTRTSNAEKMEGERKAPQILVIVEWPSREAAQAFYESEAYRPYRQSRIDGARNEFLLAPGEDVSKAANVG